MLRRKLFKNAGTALAFSQWRNFANALGEDSKGKTLFRFDPRIAGRVNVVDAQSEETLATLDYQFFSNPLTGECFDYSPNSSLYFVNGLGILNTKNISPGSRPSSDRLKPLGYDHLEHCQMGFIQWNSQKKSFSFLGTLDRNSILLDIEGRALPPSWCESELLEILFPKSTPYAFVLLLHDFGKSQLKFWGWHTQQKNWVEIYANHPGDDSEKIPYLARIETLPGKLFQTENDVIKITDCPYGERIFSLQFYPDGTLTLEWIGRLDHGQALDPNWHFASNTIAACSEKTPKNRLRKKSPLLDTLVLIYQNISKEFLHVYHCPDNTLKTLKWVQSAEGVVIPTVVHDNSFELEENTLIFAANSPNSTAQILMGLDGKHGFFLCEPLENSIGTKQFHRKMIPEMNDYPVITKALSASKDTRQDLSSLLIINSLPAPHSISETKTEVFISNAKNLLFEIEVFNGDFLKSKEQSVKFQIIFNENSTDRFFQIMILNQEKNLKLFSPNDNNNTQYHDDYFPWWAALGFGLLGAGYCSLYFWQLYSHDFIIKNFSWPEKVFFFPLILTSWIICSPALATWCYCKSKSEAHRVQLQQDLEMQMLASAPASEREDDFSDHTNSYHPVQMDDPVSTELIKYYEMKSSSRLAEKFFIMLNLKKISPSQLLRLEKIISHDELGGVINKHDGTPHSLKEDYRGFRAVTLLLLSDAFPDRPDFNHMLRIADDLYSPKESTWDVRPEFDFFEKIEMGTRTHLKIYFWLFYIFQNEETLIRNLKDYKHQEYRMNRKELLEILANEFVEQKYPQFQKVRADYGKWRDAHETDKLELLDNSQALLFTEEQIRSIPLYVRAYFYILWSEESSDCLARMPYKKNHQILIIPETIFFKTEGWDIRYRVPSGELVHTITTLPYSEYRCVTFEYKDRVGMKCQVSNLRREFQNPRESLLGRALFPEFSIMH